MARVLGKSTVLPDIPYSPTMMDLPSISLAKDTLPARNAMGQGLTQASPRPAAPVINTPSFLVPESQPLALEVAVAGGGFGQGVVPNAPRPAPVQVNAPRLDLTALHTNDNSMGAYELRGQRLTPEAQYLRPSHMQEIYGDFDHSPNVSHLNRVRPETMLPKIDAHQPTEVFGNSPAFELDRASIRPTNPRMLSTPPTINIAPAGAQRIPIRERPIIPASTQPMINHSSLIRGLGPAKKIRMEAKHIAPPVRNSDLGGLGAENSNGFGTGIGRAFGADAALHTPF